MGKQARINASLKAARTAQTSEMAATMLTDLVDSQAPPEMVAGYLSTFEWANDHPEEAEFIRNLDEKEIALTVMGIAYHEIFNFPIEARISRAEELIIWCILNQITFLYEWPTPVAAMTPEDVIAAIHADRLAGLIPPPTKDEVDAG